MPFSVHCLAPPGWTASLMGAGLLAAGVAQTNASELEERMPADMLFDMVDPTLCMMPPQEVDDAALVAMLDSDDPEMAPPVTGDWEHRGERWRAYGQGWFNVSDTSGMVAATELILRSESDELQHLCLILSPHQGTQMVAGEADLVGPTVEGVDGDTFMVVGLLGERLDGEFAPQAEVLTQTGSLDLERPADDILAGSLAFDARLVDMQGQPLENAEASLTLEVGELHRESAMRVVNWGSDDLQEAAAPAVSEEELAEVRQLFLDDIRLEVEPVLTPGNSDIVQHTVYRYDYDTFATLSEDSGWRSSRETFFYRDGEQLVPFQRPSTDMDLPFFVGLVDPDFVLDESSADDFRTLLKTLTGEDFFDEDEVKLDNIVNVRPDEWIFFTGTFFDHYKAFAAYTDDEGRVEKVVYRLKQQPAS